MLAPVLRCLQGYAPELEGLRDTGAPAWGAEGGALVNTTAQRPRIYNPVTGGKLSVQLGRTLPRVAPEIYLDCLAEGARSMREWVRVNFNGQNGT